MKIVLGISGDRLKALKALAALGPAFEQIEKTFGVQLSLGDSINIKELHLEELGLNTRTLGALRRIGVRTAGDLSCMRVEDLKDIRNFGPGSIHEVEVALSKLGLKLREE